MQCPKCQFENREGVNFCEKCGTKMESVCPNCGAKIPLDRQFCGGCGTKLGLPPEPPSKDLSFDEKLTRIQKYLPKGLTEKILSQRDRIEGERKQVTVMFCDMEGFTALSAKLGIEEAYSIMDQVYEILIHKVHDYEGTVNEMTGDGIMAIFGAPIALEDASQRAIRSALAIHRELAKFSNRLKQEKEYTSPLRMRIGIHTGPVVVGTLGNDLRVEFKAVGDTVNLASRMEGLADPGSTYVSVETFKLTEGLFRFEAVGKKEVKGKDDPINVYRVIAPSTRKTRFDVSAERGLTPFIGRERELELLLDGFERSKSGRGQAFSIVAEAGIGKSRLLYEFRKTVTHEDVTFLEGKCLSYSKGVAYHPIIDILKSNFNVQEDDTDLEISERVQKGLQIFGLDEASILPYLLELLSVQDSGIDKTPMSPEAKKDRIIEAVKKITLRGSEIRPLIIAFEDLHWIDKSSEDYLKVLLDSISGARIFLIFTYRPEFVHTWGRKSYHNQVNLNRLSNRESLLMVSHLLDADHIDSDLEDLILEKTEGVPFFIEEFLRSLKDLKFIDRKDNKYHLAKAIQDLAIPSTIQDVIMARVDSLSEAAKKVLQKGSGIEREFSYRLIKQVTGLPEKELLSHLSALKDLELLYERGIYPQSSYIFKHALTREVVYDSILTKRKKRLHENIGKAIEELYKDNIDEHYGLLAKHFIESESYEKGIHYSIKAGDKAAAVFAWHAARNHYDNALGMIKENDLEKRAEVLKKLANVTYPVLDMNDSLNYAESALELYEKLGDKHNELNMRMHITMLYIGGHWDGAKEDKALQHLEKMAAIVEEEPDSVEKGLIYQRTSHLYLHRGQPATTLAWAQKAVDVFDRLSAPMGTSMGTALTYTGRINDGIAYNEKNWDPVLKASIPLIISVLGHELSLTLALVRNVSRAKKWGEQALSEVKKAGPMFEGYLWRTLTLIYALSGETIKAEEACQTEKKIESKTLVGCYFEDATCIGFHYLRKGEWNKAREYLEWALRIHQDRNNGAAVSACSFTLGSLELEQKNYPEAKKLLLRSLDICRKGGNVIFELWVLPVLCELHLKMGQPDKAAGYVDRGFELLKPDQDWFGLPALMYMAKGMLATEVQDWKTATEFFEKGIDLNKKYQLLWDEAKTCYELGIMFLTRNRKEDRESARQKFDFALEIFEKIGAKKDIEKVLNQKELL
jgi:class 3 adenylate cyclase/tetratricopeptide (TPR) repeat protein